MQAGFEFNDEFKRAFQVIENTHRHVFITGKAGTGKSTLLQYFRSRTNKNIVVLAPTGVAAVNVKAQTIHSFFRFRPDITPAAVSSIKIPRAKRETLHNIDVIVIDEISMVRADLLDCMDQMMRLYGKEKHRPFGGAQMVFFGDLFQLPPVVKQFDRDLFGDHYQSPYFFHARTFAELPFEIIELKKIYRQKDAEFVELLNSIRHNASDENHLRKLNERVQPDFKPDIGDYYVCLTTTNAMADHINQEQLQLSDKRAYHYEGRSQGEFEEKNFPACPVFDFKLDSQVMLLSNDPLGRWVNGTLGKIVSVEEKMDAVDVINVELTDGRRIGVTPFTWEMYRFFYNEASERIESETVGSFTQYPLRLAWALTIHKSQGKTFSKVIIDVGQGTFSHGQVYVALSRCTTLEGVVLRRPILKRHIILDERVVDFMNKHQVTCECALDGDGAQV